MLNSTEPKLNEKFINININMIKPKFFRSVVAISFVSELHHEEVDINYAEK